MRKKIQLGLVLAAAFLAGGLLTNIYGVSEATAKKPFPFIKRVSLSDDATGNAAGWNPDFANNQNIFTIQDTDVSATTSSVIVNVEQNSPILCNAFLPAGAVGNFKIFCESNVGGPEDGAKLHYTVINP